MKLEHEKQNTWETEKYMRNWNNKYFSIEALRKHVRKLLVSYILDLAKIVWALRILSQKSSWSI